MPENVVFTKINEAREYASEVDGQVVGEEEDWRVIGAGYHKGGGTPHEHPHTEAVTQEEVVSALGELRLQGGDPDDKKRSQVVMNKATREQIAHAESVLSQKESYGGESPPLKEAQGGMVDELGYMHGGMPLEKRGPIKYAAGGAVRGKRFVGTF